MKSQLNKIFKITLVILFFTLSKSYSVESVTELTDAISEAREKLSTKHLKKLIKQLSMFKKLSIMTMLKMPLKL